MGIRGVYTGRVRKYAREQPIAEAVERAITECIQEGILKEFLEKNRREAKNVSTLNMTRRSISGRSGKKPGRLARGRRGAWREDRSDK